MSGESSNASNGDSNPGPSRFFRNRFLNKTFKSKSDKPPSEDHTKASGSSADQQKPATSSSNHHPEPQQQPPQQAEEDDDSPKDATFECNICLDIAKDAVVSMCGHLFCWPCIHQWLETRPNSPLCPVCKAGISKDKVIPIYGHGNEGKVDPRDKVPPRPQGTRPAPEPSSPFSNMGLGEGGFQLSFGIGAFPFSMFASTFNLGGNAANAAANQGASDQGVQEINEFLQKIFLYVAALFMIWLVVA